MLEETKATFTKKGLRCQLVAIGVETMQPYYQCRINRKRVWNEANKEMAKRKFAIVINSYLLQTEIAIGTA